MEERQKVNSIENKKVLIEKSLEHELIQQRIQSWIAIQAKRLNI